MTALKKRALANRKNSCKQCRNVQSANSAASSVETCKAQKHLQEVKKRAKCKNSRKQCRNVQSAKTAASSAGTCSGKAPKQMHRYVTYIHKNIYFILSFQKHTNMGQFLYFEHDFIHFHEKSQTDIFVY